MAQPAPEAELVRSGIITNNAINTSFCQNMYWKQGNWQVRKGFGQIGQYDTTLSRWTLANRLGLTIQEGVQKHLGSHHMETSFGHKQIISVFEILAFTNNLAVGEINGAGSAAYIIPDNNDRLEMYWVHIYDITTNETYEELLLNNRVPSNLPTFRGHYEFNGQFSAPKVRSGGGKSAVSFIEKNDMLFFSSPDLGTFYYRPSIFRGNRSKSLKGAQEPSYYSENSLVKEVVLSENRVYAESGYVYFGFFPEPINAVALLNDRVVYASDKVLYVSDPHMPTSITVLNTITIATDNVITAIHEINGALLVFTKDETFIVQPPATFELGHARVTKINSSIGCANNRLITMVNNVLTWVDKNGVYQNSGELAINPISGNIDAFFKDFMSNPLSHYLIETGECSTSADQPQIQNWFQSSFASLTYSSHLKLLFLTIPAQRITLCQSANGEWSLWSYDSAAYFEVEGVTDTPKVGVRKNMDCDQLVCSKDRVYAIGLDLENKITADGAKIYTGGAWVPSPQNNQAFRSFFISQYGLGGGVDRNTNYEDNRYGIGVWTVTDNTATFPAEDAGGARKVSYDTPLLIMGKPILLPKEKTAGYESNDADILIPVKMHIASNRILSQLHSVKHLRIKFFLDEQNWNPVVTTVAPKTVMTPIEPSAISTFNAGLGFWNANWTMVTGDFTSEALGNGAYQIDWSAHQWNIAGAGAQVAHFWNQQQYAGATGLPLNEPELPLVFNETVTLFYIPVKRINKHLSVSSMNLSVTEGFVFYSNYGAYPSGTTNWDRTKNFVFNFSSLGFQKNAAGANPQNHDLRYEDVVAQGVDWCYSSEPIGIADGNRYKARGTYTEIKSKGTSDAQIANSWGVAATGFNNNMPRVFNTVVSSENRQWNSQIVDYGSLPPGIDQNETLPQSTTSSPSIITKILDTARVMKLKVFNYGDAIWGQKGTQTGNTLIDDEQFATIANSNSTRGSWVNWMFFGHILNRAEKLVLKSSKAALRKLGGRRRRGK